MLRSLVLREIHRRGYALIRAHDPAILDEDGLRSVHAHGFVDDPKFVQAYARGVEAAGRDYNWRWRVHIGLWAAQAARRLPGDFVECGVNRGFLASAIMQSLDWNSVGKMFWLLDTFAGVDESQLELREREIVRRRRMEAPEFYVHDVDSVRANFAEWPNAHIVVGSVPGTLHQITAEQIGFLHLDMNNSAPEVATLETLWPRLVVGALVLLDDYGYRGFEMQHDAMDSFAGSRGLTIATLPTGQGLLLKT